MKRIQELEIENATVKIQKGFLESEIAELEKVAQTRELEHAMELEKVKRAWERERKIVQHENEPNLKDVQSEVAYVYEEARDELVKQAEAPFKSWQEPNNQRRHTHTLVLTLDAVLISPC
jgi:hypothetical protein